MEEFDPCWIIEYLRSVTVFNLPLIGGVLRARICKRLCRPETISRNQFQGIDSANIWRLAGRSTNRVNVPARQATKARGIDSGATNYKLQIREFRHQYYTEAEFLDEIQTKVLKVFLLAIYSQRSIALPWDSFLQTHSTSHVFLHFRYWYCKGERSKFDTKPYPLAYDLRNPSWNQPQNNAQKPQRNCTFMNSASVQGGSDKSGTLSKLHCRIKKLVKN